jgi:signal transduction histidine kinase
MVVGGEDLGVLYGDARLDPAQTSSERRFRSLMPLLALGLAIAAALVDPGSGAETVVAFLGLVPLAAWAWWRLPPIAVVVLVAACDLYALSSGGLEPMLFLLSLAAVIVGGWEESQPVAIGAMTVAVATPVLVDWIHGADILVPVWIMGIVLPYYLGRTLRAQVTLTIELAAARRGLAEMAVLDERRRIARDVHDLVGHGLAAVMLQVTGARHVLRRDPDAADDALAAAEEIGRRSLHDLRGALNLMRSTDDGGAAPPIPGAADIGAVVDRARDTGLIASFQVAGDLARIDPAVGLSLHRVVEEALANARRHAPEAATDLKLTVGPERAELLVETVGPTTEPEAGAADRPRYGLIGMRERMAAVGGHLDAGPTSLGWRVHCIAPLTTPEVTDA